MFFQKPHGLHHQPVGYLLRFSAQGNRLLKHISHMLGGSKDPRVILRKPKFLLIPSHLLRLKLRLPVADLFDPLIAYDHGHQIRIRKIPVILGILLGPHGIGILFIVIPPPGLLDHLFPLLDQLDLSPFLPLNRPGNRFKRV